MQNGLDIAKLEDKLIIFLNKYNVNKKHIHLITNLSKSTHLFHEAQMYIVAAVAAISTSAASASNAAGRALASGATAICGRRGGCTGVSGACRDIPL